MVGVELSVWFFFFLFSIGRAVVLRILSVFGDIFVLGIGFMSLLLERVCFATVRACCALCGGGFRLVAWCWLLFQCSAVLLLCAVSDSVC